MDLAVEAPIQEGGRQSPRYAWLPVSAVAACAAVLLGVTSGGYGYHRDELYFRMLASHPAWGYVDQPPMTPMLVRASTSVFGDSLPALRLPAIVSLLVTLFVVAALARELGGGRLAQTVTAIGVVAPFPLIAGHVMLTASPDMVFWTLTILFVLRALLRSEPYWWLWAGVVVGVSLWNKQLIVLLLIGLLAGLLITGPRRVLAIWQPWAGVAIAVAIASPTLVYQATNHWPELSMAGAISQNKGGDDRVMFVPFQIILFGPLVYIWIRGLAALFQQEAWRSARALAWAYPVVCLVVLATGGQVYYTFGLLALYLAAGAVLVERRVSATGRIRRTAVVLAVSVLGAGVIALPLVPVGDLGATGIGALNQATRDQVGWPAYVSEVAKAYQALPEADRGSVAIVTGNYGEAGALDRFGGRYGVPSVYSGQNELYFYGPPPESATAILFVGRDPGPRPPLPGFSTCTTVGTLDNRLGVDNEEQGRLIVFCQGRSVPWSKLWPEYQHYD